MIKQVQESTKEKPFGFFEYFIKKGFSSEYNRFFEGLDDLGFPIVEHNNEEMYYYYSNYDESGKEQIIKVIFQENISKTLDYNIEKSIGLITENVEKIYLEGKISVYLSLRLIDLTELVKKTEQLSLLVSYGVNLKLYQLIMILYEKYGSFIDKYKHNIINVAEKHLNQNTHIDALEAAPRNYVNKDVKTFKWKLAPTLLIQLIGILMDENAIDNTEDNRNKLFEAFSYNNVTDSHKIKWKIISSRSNMAPLYRFLDLLIVEGFIEKVAKNELAYLIDSLFLDINGNPFENTDVKVNQISKKATVIENQLHNKIKQLKTDNNTV
jgi:hypothetical protein